jgi:hypothetical protein
MLVIRSIAASQGTKTDEGIIMLWARLGASQAAAADLPRGQTLVLAAAKLAAYILTDF